MNNLLDYFNKIDNISHAFLIGNVIFDEIENNLTSIIKNNLLKNNNLNLKENPDIYYFNQYEHLITKDNIIDLLTNLSKTSQFSDTKIYIINGAEKLSDSVYNSILKTLEEPESNIYAFLITKNIEAVKPTIKSRCQIIYLNSSKENIEIDENIIKLSDRLINDIETKKINTIAMDSSIYFDIDNRETFQRILKNILNIYNRNLKIMINENFEENNEILTNNDIISLSKKILIIDKTINLLNSYLNKNSAIDRFIIEIWRC